METLIIEEVRIGSDEPTSLIIYDAMTGGLLHEIKRKR